MAQEKYSQTAIGKKLAATGDEWFKGAGDVVQAHKLQDEFWRLNEARKAFFNERPFEINEHDFERFLAGELLVLANRAKQGKPLFRCESLRYADKRRCHKWADQRADDHYICNYCYQKHNCYDYHPAKTDGRNWKQRDWARTYHWYDERPARQYRLMASVTSFEELMERLKQQIPEEWFNKLMRAGSAAGGS